MKPSKRLPEDEDFGIDPRHRVHPDEDRWLWELFVEPKGPDVRVTPYRADERES